MKVYLDVQKKMENDEKKSLASSLEDTGLFAPRSRSHTQYLHWFF